MKIEPSGVLIVGVCEVQTENCTAKTPAPTTAVWALPARRQINVCSSCLEEMVRSGDWQVEGSRLRRRADVAVFDKAGNLQLVVEAKYIKPNEETLNRAVQIRRNLLAHSGIPNSPFLLIVFPSHTYLWKKAPADNFDRQADYSVDTEVFSSVPNDWKDWSKYMLGAEFERLVSEWIKDLSNREDDSEIPDWVQASGLYEAIKNGSVVTEAAV